MDTETENAIKSRLEIFPKELRRNIFSVEIKKILETMPEAQLLNKNQITAIENEVLLIFLGFEDIPSLATNIKFTVQISRDRADKITRGIAQQILIPHTELLDKIFRAVDTKALNQLKNTTSREAGSSPERKPEPLHKKEGGKLPSLQTASIPQNNTTDGLVSNLPNQTREEPSPIPKKVAPQINTLPKTQTPPTPPAVPTAPMALVQPAPPVVPSQEMFAEKMEKQVHIPKDERVVEKKAPDREPTQAEPDPYREPPD